MNTILPNYYKVIVDGLNVKLEPNYEELLEVVRCKDCHWWSEHNINEYVLCGRCVKSIPKITRCDDFCSYGEKRK